MPPPRPFSRIDTLDLKSAIVKRIGLQKAEKYFFNLKRFLNLKISKLEFNKFCYSILGRENIRLHNLLIRSVLNNACFSHGPPNRQAATGHSQNTKTSNGKFGDIFQLSPQKGRSITSRDRRLHDRPSPLGPHGKMNSGHVTEVTNSCDVQRSRDQQSAPELISIGSKALLEVASVEDGEEVEQVRASPSVQSRSPIRAPLGIGRNDRGHSYRGSHCSFASVQRCAKFEVPECCRNSYVLPDLVSLQKRLEQKLETQGLSLSVDYANLLSNGLDAQLKRIIKPCLELAKSRCDLRRKSGNLGHGMNGSWNEEDMQKSDFCYAASLTDFKVAMQSNPYLLGVDWPVQLEKICTYVSME